MSTDPRGKLRGTGAPAALTEQDVRAVERICRARVHPRDVEDAVQETFVQYMLADRAAIHNPAAWLSTVAVRVCAQHHRRHYRKPETALDETVIDRHADPAERATDSALLSSAVGGLRPTDRLILRRVYMDDVSYSQLANELHVTETHARVLALRARRRAARSIEPDATNERDVGA